jgi:hypothetical protein
MALIQDATKVTHLSLPAGVTVPLIGNTPYDITRMEITHTATYTYSNIHKDK